MKKMNNKGRKTMKKWKENISWRWCTFESGEHVKFNDFFYLQEDQMSEIKNIKKNE
jgi:hypothetical protein